MTREELLPIAKPILFNTEMVKAILEGRKTVTRRIVKFLDGKNPNWTGYIKDGLTLYNGSNEPCNKKPPYAAGDYLYVRETWHKYTKRVGKGESCHLAEFYGYKASIANSEDAHEPWKPSIHMPKEAARIFLKVTDVRVERLTYMLTKDFCNEGLNLYKDDGRTEKSEIELEYEFEDLWNSTIKKADLDKYGWDANPWVWVIEFERAEVE